MNLPTQSNMHCMCRTGHQSAEANAGSSDGVHDESAVDEMEKLVSPKKSKVSRRNANIGGNEGESGKADELDDLLNEMKTFIDAKEGSHTFSRQADTFKVMMRYYGGKGTPMDFAKLLVKYSGTEGNSGVQSAFKNFENDQSVENLRTLYDTVKAPVVEKSRIEEKVDTPKEPEPPVLERPRKISPYGFGNMKAVDKASNGDGIMTDDELQSFLDSGKEYCFKYEGEQYSIKKDGGRYKAYDSSGKCIDIAVQINNNLTVDQFVEVGGLPGLSRSDRLYIGAPEGEMSMWIGNCNKDAKAGKQLSASALIDDPNARLIHKVLSDQAKKAEQ